MAGNASIVADEAAQTIGMQAGADTQFGISGINRTITSVSGNATMTISGVDDSIIQASGLAQMALKGVDNTINMGNAAGTLQVGIDLFGQKISVIAGDVHVNLVYSPAQVSVGTENVSFYVSPILGLGLNIDASTCLSPRQIMEVFKFILEALSLLDVTSALPDIPTLDMLSCTSFWTSPIP